jgi:hypothetical protein
MPADIPSLELQKRAVIEVLAQVLCDDCRTPTTGTGPTEQMARERLEVFVRQVSLWAWVGNKLLCDGCKRRASR